MPWVLVVLHIYYLIRWHIGEVSPLHRCQYGFREAVVFFQGCVVSTWLVRVGISIQVMPGPMLLALSKHCQSMEEGSGCDTK